MQKLRVLLALVFVSSFFLSCTDESVQVFQQDINEVSSALSTFVPLEDIVVTFDEDMIYHPSEEDLALMAKAESLAGARMPDNVVSFIEMENGEVINWGQYSIEGSGIETYDGVRKIDFEEELAYVMTKPIRERVSNDVYDDYLKLLETGDDINERFIVSFVNIHNTPKRPDFYNEDRYSENNLRARQKTHDQGEALFEIRYKELSRKVEQISAINRSNVIFIDLEEYARLGSLAVVEMPISEVAYFLSRADVDYVGYADKTVPPPTNNMSDAIQLVGLPSITLPSYSGVKNWIGMLDSGVTTTHVLANVWYWRDCINGTVNSLCTRDAQNTTATLDPSDTWPGSHGTPTNSILNGTNALGNASKGATNFIVDSYKMTDHRGSHTPAALRAFDAVINLGNDIILAEMQLDGNSSSEISRRADTAYDGGVVVIAAAGNQGPAAGSISAPGNAHKALAVGAYDVELPYTMFLYTGRGPTEDGRVKPEFTAPTNTLAAKPNISTTAIGEYWGTSGAAPYGAAAAALARGLMCKYFINACDPGAVYAFMLAHKRSITNAPRSEPLKFNFGRATVFWISVTIPANGTQIIPFSTPHSALEVDAAIWWPESHNQVHNNFALWLYAPGGAIAHTGSLYAGSVYQNVRLRAGTSLYPAGQYQVVIRPNGTTSVQKVFVVVRATHY